MRKMTVGASAPRLFAPRLFVSWLFASGLLISACDSGRSGDPVATPPRAATASADPATVGDTTGQLTARPFRVEVPNGYSASTPAPLLVVLHGYTASGESIRDFFKLQSIADDRGFLAVYPDGTKDSQGAPFWNATDACCDLGSAGVDDSGYLTALIGSIRRSYSVDPKRIYVLGHSNGGFMSYRMACEHADTIAAIVSLAGATFADRDACRPSDPVSVLQIHGTSDQVIGFTGGQIFGNRFPGALTTVETWASLNGCRPTPPPPTDERIDLDSTIAGTETLVSEFTGCPPGGAVELWTVEGGVHSPVLAPGFPSRVVDFLYAHPKP